MLPQVAVHVQVAARPLSYVPTPCRPCPGAADLNITFTPVPNTGSPDCKDSANELLPECYAVNMTIPLYNVNGAGTTVFCAVSNEPAVTATWANNWTAVLATVPALCTNATCGDKPDRPQTATGSALIGSTNQVLVTGLWRPGYVSTNTAVQVVCGLVVPGSTCADQPIIMTRYIDKTCFPGDARVRRLDPVTGSLVEARVDSLALGDTLECWKPEVDLALGRETNYTRGTCKVRPDISPPSLAGPTRPTALLLQTQARR